MNRLFYGVTVLSPPNPDAPIDLPDELQSNLTSGGILTTYWPTILTLLLAAGVVFWWWRRRKTSDRKVLRGTIYFTAATLVTVLAVAFGVNTWVGYVPSWTAAGRMVGRLLGTTQGAPVEIGLAKSGAPSVGQGARDLDRLTNETEGALTQVQIPSNSKDVAESPAWVYLPPDYDKPGNTQKYPVFYVVHGGPGTGADWFSAGNLEAAANLLIEKKYLPPCIIVSPDLNGGPAVIDREPLNIPEGPQLEDYLVTDVVGWTDTNLRTQADREHRVLGGMSAGAFVSINVGVENSDVFGGVISLMPYLEPYTPEIIENPEAANRYNPIRSIADASTELSLPVYMAQGEMERGDEIQAIKRALDNRNIVNTVQLFADLPHNWTMARDSMPYGLIWTARQLQWID